MALREGFGSASAIRKYSQHWRRAGFLLVLWQWRLAEYDDLKDIALDR
jgi:hypothetical protein